MSKRSKSPRPAPEVLDPVLAQALATAIAPTQLLQAERDDLRDRIMQRIRDEAPSRPARRRRGRS